MTESLANKPDTEAAIKSTEKDLEKASQTGFFNISSVAKSRIQNKRKRKGLGDIKPRENNVYR